MLRPPHRPTGASNEARFWQWAYDSLVELMPQIGPGVHTDFTTRGTFRRTVSHGRASSPPPPSLTFHPFYNVLIHPTDGLQVYTVGYWFDSSGKVYYWNTSPVASPDECDAKLTNMQVLPFDERPTKQHTGPYVKFVNPFATQKRFDILCGELFVSRRLYPDEANHPGPPYFSYKVNNDPGNMVGIKLLIAPGNSCAIPLLNKGLRDVAVFFITLGSPFETPPAPYPVPPGRLL